MTKVAEALADYRRVLELFPQLFAATGVEAPDLGELHAVLDAAEGEAVERAPIDLRPAPVATEPGEDVLAILDGLPEPGPEPDAPVTEPGPRLPVHLM